MKNYIQYANVGGWQFYIDLDTRRLYTYYGAGRSLWYQLPFVSSGSREGDQCLISDWLRKATSGTATAPTR